MYLHRMTIAALGPFAGTHTIEFADLAASGLFLLEGPTGSGKSTLIDAIVFAIYGKVASRDASEDRLRSAHAAPQDETFVDLVLETGSGIYRVRRSPAYQRPKQRGTGTTLQQAQVRLWRLTSPDAETGDLLSSRADEAGAELRRAVGLDREQFVQTIVLPQGEFANFLRADPESRRGLLQQVFGTEVYERLQQRLEKMRAEVGRAVEESRQSVDRAVARFVGAADPEAEDPVRVAGPDSAVDRARAVCDALAATATAAEQEARLAREAAESARVEHDRRRRAAETLARRDRARAELAALEAGAPQHAADRERAGAARRVLPLLPLVAAVGPAERARAEADQAVAVAAQACDPALRALVQSAPEAEPALVAERDRCTGERAALARALALEAALPGRTAALAVRQEQVATTAAALATSRAELAARPAARAEREAVRVRVSGEASGLGPATVRLTAVQERWTALQDATALEPLLAEAERAVAAAAATATAAVDEAAALHRARIAGMAGELAAQLRSGAPCPVCGATEHPAVAARGDAVDDADLARAEERRTAASEALAVASAARERLSERRAQRVEAAGDTGTLAEQLAQAGAEVEAARAATTALAEAETSLRAFDAQTQELTSAQARREQEAAVETERLAAALAELERDANEVRAARGSAAGVSDRVAELDRTAQQAAAWLRAIETARRTGDAALAARRALEAGLAEHGIAEVAEVEAASLPLAELTRLEQTVQHHEAELVRVRGVLAEPEVRAAEDEVDVPGALVVLTEATARAEALGARAAREGLRRDAAAQALDALVEAVEQHRTRTADAGPVVRMANLAGASTADNSRALTLATYVLARRFDDLVQAANARLVTMSDGRYALLHSERREDVSTRKKGLALAVMDYRTGVARDPRTLSGGETFYVALCLALGLADVVTAEAGGIDLGTLFVDEGFGSLDPESLDVVLAELSRLRDGGRVVGVVSHVETMKTAIAERIEVRRRPDGSSTLTVRA